MIRQTELTEVMVERNEGGGERAPYFSYAVFHDINVEFVKTGMH